ncbi:MAG: type II toxin-antitoxin system death-on-curing family toxin [Verrucomicrobia bacterium]|jgi:death-on-curing protein|nr:type II toxin-antitoxin system death-on-curing family toxin [Verrucomicrobiota bacterium]
MKEPYWLGREECLALHEMMVAHYGGTTGLRDEGLLESALGKPQNLFAYGDPTMADLAASYASGIVKNHPFLDGNKRTGFMMGAGFLERNGYEFFADEADAAIRTLALAAGEMTEKAYAAWLETNSTKPE